MAKENLRRIDPISSLRFLTTERISRTSDDAFAVLKKELEREEGERAERERQRRHLTKQLRRPIVDLLRQDKQLAKDTEAFVAYARDLQDFKPDFAEKLGVPPSVLSPAQVAWTNTEPIGFKLTIAPPYDYFGTYLASWQGAVVEAKADHLTGSLSSRVKCIPENECAGTATSHVGILFKPAINGQIMFSATLQLKSFWSIHTSFNEASSMGTFRLSASEFLLDDPPDALGTPLPGMEDELWKETCWWPECATESGQEWVRTPTLLVKVDNEHFYDLWVILRTVGYADGVVDDVQVAFSTAQISGYVESMSITFVAT
jgi:hypothetical protein